MQLLFDHMTKYQKEVCPRRANVDVLQLQESVPAVFHFFGLHTLARQTPEFQKREITSPFDQFHVRIAF